MALPIGAGVPDGARLAFRAFRNGSEIGTHVLGFSASGDTLQVQIAVDFAVGFGPITLYRYRLRGTETWRRGVLMEASTDTTDGGDKDWLRVARRNGVLRVEASGVKPYAAPEGSLLSSHWNRDELKAPMINMQTGELLDFIVQRRGTDTIQAAGRRVEATHFALTGPATLNLWYDSANLWTALRGLAKDGSAIEYRLEAQP